MSDLQIPYRVVNIAVDDLGASAAKKYDLEAWLPGQQRYRELTSTSNTTDFQARRLDIRMRDAGPPARKPETLHTLNGTAVAVGLDVERRVEARDLEEPQDGRVRADERHVALVLGDLPQGAEQDAEPGRVDELDGAEIEDDPAVPVVDDRLEALAEARRRREVDLAADRDDVDASRRALIQDLEVGDDRGHVGLSDSACSGLSMRR